MLNSWTITIQFLLLFQCQAEGRLTIPIGHFPYRTPRGYPVATTSPPPHPQGLN